MATVINNSDYRSKIADATITAFTFVKLASLTNVTPCSAITDIVYGVAQNAASAGEVVTVKVSGESKVVAAAALALDAIVGTSTGATAQALASTQYPRGKVVEASGATADSCVIQLFDSGIAKS